VTPVVSIAVEHDGAEWDAFVARRPWASGYHAWTWRGVFRHALAHEPISLMARQGGEVVGILPMVYMKSFLFGRALVSLPFLNYGGVVADSSDAREALLRSAAAEARARRCRHVELRHTSRQCPELPCRQHKVAMRLALADGLWDRLDRKVRNQIRKSEKAGLVGIDGGVELLDEFYAVFARNMRDLGTPVTARRFFSEVIAAFPDRTRVHVVRRQGTPVAAAITYRSGDTIEVPWASSIRDYNVHCPNHALYWRMIQLAVAAGCRTFDFGRSTPGEGTFKFKEQWGAEPSPLYWEYALLSGGVPDHGPGNPKFRLAIETWKKLPLGLATMAGPWIGRAIP
jgi:FemAB-related protein (PEP-CTERM system-associated)